MGRADEAPRLHAVRGAGRRLGQRRHGADGAADAAGAARHPHEHGRRRSPTTSSRRSTPASPPPAGPRPTNERTPGISSTSSTSTASATPRRWANRPQTLYALEDSPVGLAAWMLDHDARSQSLIARVFDGGSEGLTGRHPRQRHALLADEHGGLIGAPVLGEQARRSSRRRASRCRPRVSVFPDEIYAAPRSWAERAYPEPDPLQPPPEGRPLRRVGAAGHVLRRAPHGIPEPAMTAPTIVLVHGAFADGSSWNDVIELPAAAGPFGRRSGEPAAWRRRRRRVPGQRGGADRWTRPSGGAFDGGAVICECRRADRGRARFRRGVRSRRGRGAWRGRREFAGQHPDVGVDTDGSTSQGAASRGWSSRSTLRSSWTRSRPI